MAERTQAEIAAGLRAATDTLKAIKTDTTAAVAGITKVGAETDGLKQKIEELEEAIRNQTGATPELIEAFDALKEQVGVVQSAQAEVATAITAVDDKVPDANPS